MSKAEEKALELYPPKMEYNSMMSVALDEKSDVNANIREKFIEGYNEALKELDKIPIYFKIPMTTHYSGDLVEFDKKVTYIVEGTEFCETDKFGDECCCWYVSTIFGTSDDKEWLLREIAELGYVPDIMDFRKGLFKQIKV